MWIKTFLLEDVFLPLNPVEEAVLVDPVNKDSEDRETIKERRNSRSESNDSRIIESIGVKKSGSDNPKKQTDNLIRVLSKNTADEDW